MPLLTSRGHRPWLGSREAGREAEIRAHSRARPYRRPLLPQNAIVVKGAREHNLKDVDVTIPRDQLIIIRKRQGEVVY